MPRFETARSIACHSTGKRWSIPAAIVSLTCILSAVSAAGAGVAFEVAPFPGPPMVSAASAVDPRTGTLYVHGGATWAGPTNPYRYSLTKTVWRYDFDTATWDSALSRAPGSRAWDNHAMLWDADARVLVLHGFRNDLSPAWDSLRRMDPIQERWLPPTFHDAPRAATLHAGFLRDPSGRWWHSFGETSIGASPTVQFLDRGAAEWQPLPYSFSDEIPVRRSDHIAVFDARRGRLIVHGGVLGPSLAPERELARDCPFYLESLHAIWTVDARERTWRRLWTSDGQYRQQRSGAIAAWSPASDAVIVFGGGQSSYPDCPLQYDPAAGDLPASLAIFDLQGNGWSVLPLDSDAARRVNAAGGYDPCTGTIVAAAGGTIDFTAPVRADFIRIQVERAARVTIRGIVGGGASQGRRAIELAFDEDVSNPIDLRLMDCGEGTTRDLPVGARRTGPRRFLVLAPAEVAVELEANPHVHLVGRLEGAPLGFIGRTAACGPRPKVVARNGEALAARRVSTTPSALDAGIAGMPATLLVHIGRSRIRLTRVTHAPISSVPELRLYDVRGRLAYSGAPGSGSESNVGTGGDLALQLAVSAPNNLASGLYFAHLRWGSWEGTGKIVLGLDH